MDALSAITVHREKAVSGTSAGRKTAQSYSASDVFEICLYRLPRQVIRLLPAKM